MNTNIFKRCFCLIILSFSSLLLYAQEEEEGYKFEIGGMVGGAYYMGDLNKNSFFKGLNPSLGAIFRYNPNLRWAVKTDLLWAKVSGSTDGLANVFPDNAQASFSRSLIEMGGQMEFNFFPYSDLYAYKNAKRYTPYIFLGLGMTVATGGETFVSPNIPLGVGFKVKIKRRLNLGFEVSFRKLFSDKLDVTDESNGFLDDPYHMESSLLKNKDWYSLMMFSLTWDFGPRCRTCNNINSIGIY